MNKLSDRYKALTDALKSVAPILTEEIDQLYEDIKKMEEGRSARLNHYARELEKAKDLGFTNIRSDY